MPIANQVKEQVVYCPACGKRMVERKGKYGPFFGCSSLPHCRKIVNLNDAHKYSEPPEPKVVIENPTEEQFDILDFVLHSDRNACVNACPGSGKTTTNVWAGNQLMRNFLGLAFNSHIQKEWEAKASRGVIKTTHSFGLWTCRKHLKNFEVDANGTKLQSIIWPMVDAQRGLEDEDKRALFHSVKKLVKIAKATLSYDFDYLCDRYGIPTNGDTELTYMLANFTLEQCRKQLSLIDYEDMIWLPHVLHLDAPKFDIVLGDEVQDWNRAQHELVANALGDGGRLIAVGDRFQSLYGFRGADTDSIPNLIRQFTCQELPLSISFRCPKKVVELAQMYNPDMQAAPWAKEGEVHFTSEKQAMAEVEPGDMILCRTNAPLVAPVYALIKRGVKATIRGRDIGKGLIVLIEKYEPKVLSLNELIFKLAEYRDREVGKLLAADRGGQAQAVEDKVDTILALSEDCQSIGDLKTKTESIFDDNKASVVASTVHRAKGFESPTVIIIRPDLIPHPMATKDWEMEQEQNIAFVAITRAQEKLVYARSGQ